MTKTGNIIKLVPPIISLAVGAIFLYAGISTYPYPSEVELKMFVEFILGTFFTLIAIIELVYFGSKYRP